jgi:hypothetical protein
MIRIILLILAAALVLLFVGFIIWFWLAASGGVIV